MKTTTALCALTFLASVFATAASAEATAYIPYQSTLPRLAQQADAVVVGRLNRVEDVSLSIPGVDAAEHPAKGNPKLADGQPFVRREAVITVSQTLKGSSHVANGELRVVSIRQMKLSNYDSDMLNGDAIYFCAKRPADGCLIVLSQERGAITASDNGGNLTSYVDLTKKFLDASAANFDGRYAAIKNSLIAAITLNGSRQSVDACTELAWNWADYASSMTEENKQTLLALAKNALPGSEERVELIHSIGRYKPEGTVLELYNIVINDATFTTSSIASWAMDVTDRGMACSLLINGFAGSSDSQKILAVRSLGLIRPKDDVEGKSVRDAAVDCVRSFLTVTSDETGLREALVAARDMRAGKDLKTELKALIDNRATNNISDEALKGAIIALASGRSTQTIQGNQVTVVFERAYLNNLALQDAVLKQIVDDALVFPFTMLITDTQGRMR